VAGASTGAAAGSRLVGCLLRRAFFPSPPYLPLSVSSRHPLLLLPPPPPVRAEFLTFLLDGLLEDVCRVRVKPVVPAVEAAPGQPDAEVAAAAWAAFRKRNASAIADIFAGQFRSRVECNQCRKCSLTFDPFTSFSVPIPMTRVRSFNVFYFDAFGSAPVEYSVHFTRSAMGRAVTYRDIVDALLVKLRDNAPPKPAPLEGTLTAAAPFTAPAPTAPEEVLLTLTNLNPCMVLSALAHWEEAGDVADRTHLFAYHLPGARGAAAAAAAAAEAAAGSTRGASSLAGGKRGAKAPRLEAAATQSGSSSSGGDGDALADWRAQEALVKAAEWRWYYDRSRPPPSMEAHEVDDGAGGDEAEPHVVDLADDSDDGHSGGQEGGDDDDAGEDDLMRLINNPPKPQLSGAKRKQPDGAASSAAAPGVRAPAKAAAASAASDDVPVGPGAADFITVWLRKGETKPAPLPPSRQAYSYYTHQRPPTPKDDYKPFVDCGDSLIIPLRHPVTGRRVTNAEFHALVALKIRRLVARDVREALTRDLTSVPWRLRFVTAGHVGPEAAAPPVAPKGA
jgi:hypothetical protein